MSQPIQNPQGRSYPKVKKKINVVGYKGGRKRVELWSEVEVAHSKPNKPLKELSVYSESGSYPRVWHRRVM